MNMRRIVCVYLVVILLFTSICPTSFAAYVYGPDKSSYTINADKLENFNFEVNKYIIEPVAVKVSESGLYSVSNLMGGNVSTKFIITDGGNNVLPVGAYGKDGKNEMNLAMYNNASNNTATVFLEEGKTYYVFMTGENGHGIKADGKDGRPSDSATLSVNLNKVTVPEDMEIYVTNKSSMDYTASNFPENTWIMSKSDEYVNLTIQNSWTVPVISGDDIDEALSSVVSTEGEENNASWYEKIVTWLLVVIGDGLVKAISWAIGSEKDISIDSILFNEFPDTRLSIFKSTRVEGNRNSFLESSGLLDSESGEGVITKFFNAFKNISVAIYIVMLLYMGVNILLSSTGKKSSKYKDRLMDWVKGLIILTLFPYVMKYSIVLNDAIVGYIADVRPVHSGMPVLSGGAYNRANSMHAVNTNRANGDMMTEMKNKAEKTGRLVYAVLYLLLVKELIGFLFIYFKRLISVIFMVIIFPLVSISYAVDKIADGKSQAFDHWVNEFILNVFMQTFQAINYVIIMSIIFAISGTGGNVNIILVLVGFEYISKGDELLRSLFSKMSGGGAQTIPKSLKDAVKTVAAVEVIKETGKQIGNIGKGFSAVRQSIDALNTKRIEHNNAILYERTHANDWFATSIMNPRRFEIVDIRTNMHELLTNASLSSEDKKELLDRLTVAKNDPKLRDDFNRELALLSDNDRDDMTEMIMANGASNETIAGNVGARGPLTEREININCKLNMEIINGGSSGKYGMLYDYYSSKNMLNADGSPMINRRTGRQYTALEYLQERSLNRKLNRAQQTALGNVQSYLGNVTGMDTDSFGVRRAQNEGRSAYSAIPRASVETGYSPRENTEFKRAERLQRKMDDYTSQINSGAISGISATDIMRMSKEWDELAQSTDVRVGTVLRQIETDMQRDHGFKMEHLKVMGAVAVFVDKENLEGTDEEVKQMQQQAGRILAETASGRYIDDDGNGNIKIRTRTVMRGGTSVNVEEENRPDKVASEIIHRAGIDNIVNQITHDYISAARAGQSADSVDCSQYVVRNESQEQIRDEAEISRRRVVAERAYNNAINEKTVSQARGEVIRSAVGLANSSVNLVAQPVVSAATFATATTVAGATGEVNPVAMYGTSKVLRGAKEGADKLVERVENTVLTPFDGEGRDPGQVSTIVNKEMDDNYGARSSTYGYRGRLSP